MAQTTVQDSRSIRFGSAMIEVGAAVDTLVNIGAVRDVQFSEEFKKIQIASDNAGIIRERIKEHTCKVEAKLMEVNLKNLASMRGGLDNLTSLPGAVQNVVDEPHTLTGNVPTVLQFRNATGALATGIVVKKGATTYVAGTDYTLGQTPAGDTTIIRMGTGIPDGTAVTISYTVTPAAATVVTSGGKRALATNVVRLTNYDENGKRFRLTIYKASSGKGLELPFVSDDADDPMLAPIELNGTLDVTRAMGDQLFEIYDEQGA